MKEAGLRRKVAIVTGASSGIGHASCLALASQGADIVLASRNLAALEDVRRELSTRGARALVVPTDVTSQEQVDNLVEVTLAQMGTIDVLVTSASVYSRRPVHSLSLDEIERVMAVNFLGSVRCIDSILPRLLQRGSGHIVVVTSMDGKKGMPGEGAYVASKFALTGFVEVLRQELHATGVSVTTVLPGRVDTPMIGSLRVPRVSAKMPPERVARAIVKAIYRPTPEVLVPYAPCKALILANAVSPGLADLAVRRLGLSGIDPSDRQLR